MEDIAANCPYCHKPACYEDGGCEGYREHIAPAAKAFTDLFAPDGAGWDDPRATELAKALNRATNPTRDES